MRKLQNLLSAKWHSNLRRCVSITVATIGFVWALGCTNALQAQAFSDQTSAGSSSSSRFTEEARYEEYERQLNSILKTRRDEEKLFIAMVVGQVRAGKIPTKLVSTSFDWVNKKRPGTKYPFIYFEKVLRLQAQQLKIEDQVPPFDFSIYRKSVGQLDNGSRTSAGQTSEVRRSSFVTPGTQKR